MQNQLIFVYNTRIFDESKRNMNVYQRPFFLSHYASSLLLVPKNAVFSTQFKKSGIIIYKSIFNGRYLFYIWSLLFILKYIHINRKYFRIIIFSIPNELALVLCLIKKAFTIKLVIDIWDIPFRDRKQSFMSKLNRKIKLFLHSPLFNNADLYIISMIRYFELKQLKLPEKKSFSYTNAIQLNFYNKLPIESKFDIFTILYQRATVSSWYGIELLLEAFQLILQKIDARLLIVGKIMPDAKKLLNNYEYKNKIYSHGFITHEEFISIANKVHTCVIPYPKIIDLEQIYPIKAIEYMAIGKAIVYTNVSGCRRLIDKAGIMVEPNPYSISKAILRIANDEQLRMKYEKSALQRATIFSAEDKNRHIFLNINKLF